MGGFAYGPSRSRQRSLQNTLQRLGNQGDKHGHLLRGPCDRCLAIFIFRVSRENSVFAASDTADRDLISSYFRFTWKFDLRDFLGFGSPFVPCEQLPIGPGPSATLYPT